LTEYIVRRLLLTLPVIVGLSMLIFALVWALPGDAVDVLLGSPTVTAEQVAHLRATLGLDDPLPVQYLRWVRDALKGDMGISVFSKRPVLDLIREQLPSTLELAMAAMLISTLLGVGLVIMAALYSNSWLDVAMRVVAMLGVSMPVFWLGLIAIFFFSLNLGWFPAAGTGGWKHLFVPALVVGFHSASTLARLVRASMLEVLREDYIVTARAKGLKERVVIARHAFRNCLIPVITILGMQFANSLGGMVVTETVFARKGIGLLVIDAILMHDIPLIQGAVLFVCLIIVLSNLVVDISYAALDPRIRYSDS